MFETPQPRKLLVVHSSDEMYGSDVIMLQIARTLQASGWQVTVVVPSDVPGPRPLSEALTECGCTVHVESLAVLRRRYFHPLRVTRFVAEWIAAFWKLRARIRRERPGIVYSNTLAVTVAAVAARWCGVPHVWHVHEIIMRPRWLGRLLCRAAARLSARVICVSAAVDGFVRANAPRAPTVVIRNGIPDPLAAIDQTAARRAVEAELGLSSDTSLVLMVGRLSEWKGAEAFLQVAERHIRAGGAAHFAVVGGTVPGESRVLEAVQRAVHAPCNRGAIHWVDFSARVPHFLSRASVFVLPSLQPDPYPTAALEALYAGIPIVTFAHGGVLEMIQPTRAGVPVPIGNIDAMGEAIETLLSDRQTAKRMGLRARSHARATAGLEGFTARIAKVLEGVLANRA